MKILVTGGAGFIGSHVADLLINQGHEVIIVDNFSTGRKENVNIKARFYEEDLRNYKKIEGIFKENKPEIIYHLAAQINIRESVENPIKDAEINILSSLNLIELAIKFNIKHFIFSSTGGAIYGDTKKIPTTEKQKEHPISPYGCAKLALEKYLHFYNKVHGLKFTSLRYSNVCGPRQNPYSEAGLISIFLNNMLSNKTPKIYGGTQTRDFVYVEDVAKANLLALNDSESCVYNVGTSKETNIIEIFSKINEFFNDKFEPEYAEIKKGEQRRSCLSYQKIRDSLEWTPETDIDRGLNRTYLWSLESKTAPVSST